MSALARACVSIAALGFALVAGCVENTTSICNTTMKAQCIQANLKVLSQHICQTQDWELRVQFTNVDLSPFATINFTLSQASSKASLPIVLQKDSQAGLYKATVKQSDLKPFRSGSAIFSVSDEAAFGEHRIDINSLFNLKKVTQEYVDPGTVGADGKPAIGSFPWPERVGVRPDGSLVVLDEGVSSATGHTAWRVLNLRFDPTKELAVTPTFLFNGASLADNQLTFAVDFNAQRLIAISEFGAAASAVNNCSGTEADINKCVNQCDTADTMFTSLMKRNYKAFAAHPREPFIAYVNDAGYLMSALLPDPATITKVSWKSNLPPPATPALRQVLLSMGQLNAANQDAPSLLAAYQDPAAMSLTLAAYRFNTAGDGSLVPDVAMTKSLSQPGLVGIKAVDALAVGDLDGDQLDELVFVRAGRIYGLSNLGGSSFCADELGAAPAEVTAMAVADINGDGRNDLVVISKLAKTVTAFLNHPNP